MDLAQIRRIVITALFSDDTLMDEFVLKGGNAVNLVYGFGSRGSVDVDLSIEEDFKDFEEAKNRILTALKRGCAASGLAVFDESFGHRPSNQAIQTDEKWGGYEVLFKLMEMKAFESIENDLDRARREALVLGPEQQRVFRVQISKFEYCAHKRQTELDDFTIYIYTPEMLAIEKLRALCQQMPEYGQRVHPTARARDFYDIYSTVRVAGFDLSSVTCQDLALFIFSAKEVPLRLLTRISLQREFHRPDWASVQLSVTGELREFDFYFDFVVDQVQLLKPLWEE